MPQVHSRMLGHILALSPISVFAAVNAPLMGQTCLYSILNLAPSTLVFARAKQTYVLEQQVLACERVTECL